MVDVVDLLPGAAAVGGIVESTDAANLSGEEDCRIGCTCDRSTEADAIGKEVVKAPELPPNATEDDVLALAWEQLRTCYDPEIPINIVDLGLIYECTVSVQPDGQRAFNVRLTLTAPGCGMGDVLVQDIKQKLEIIPTVAVANVELVFDPPWNQSMMTEAARLQTGMF